jgi:predicted nucleic acid-binding protein
MNLYAESSAILAWLLGEDTGQRVRKILANADAIVSSDLTLVECDRVLHRAQALRAITEATVVDRKARLRTAALGWNVLRIAPQIIERARQSFPEEPIRTLDALHVASALYARATLPGLVLLSLDDRVRRVSKSLGFEIQPSDPDAF